MLASSFYTQPYLISGFTKDSFIPHLVDPVFFIYLNNETKQIMSSINQRLRAVKEAKISYFFDRNLVTHVITDHTRYTDRAVFPKNESLKNFDITSRSASILAQVKIKKSKCPIKQAKEFGIPILYVDDILKGNLFQATLKNNDQSGQIQIQDKKVKKSARNLKKPYIKVEDKSRKYRPLVLEMNEWPFITKILMNKCTSKVDRVSKYKANTNRFCEHCNCKFNDLNLHLQSTEHKNNVSKAGVWQKLDDLISKQPTPSSLVKLLKEQRKDK